MVLHLACAFLAIDKFFEFWRIFSFFNLWFFKTLLLPQFCSDHYQILTEDAPIGPPLALCFFFFFLVIGQFFEIWRIFSSSNIAFFKSLLLSDFSSDLYQILTEGAPSGPPFGLCFFGD